MRAVRRPPSPSGAGALWFLVALIPTSNLLFLIGTGMGERLLYLPSVGLALVLAAGFAALSRAWPTRAARIGLATAAGLIVGLLGVRTFVHNADWSDAHTFWRCTVSAAPRCVRALRTYARLLLREDWRASTEPVELLERAVAIEPEDIESRASLAFAFAVRSQRGLAQGQRQDAERDRAAAAEQLRAASALEERTPDGPSSHLARARATLAITDAVAGGGSQADLLAQANASYRRAISLDPTNVPFQRELAGFLLTSSKERDAALSVTLASLLLMPEQDGGYGELFRRACQRAGIEPGALLDDSTVPPLLRSPAAAPVEQRARLTQVWSASIALALELLGRQDEGWARRIRETGSELGVR
jgi:hypothetical protein